MMTVHKLSAGDGYTYLTRQVASADERRPQGQSLSEYYVSRGNPPGVWVGAGAAQLGVEGSEVTEAQMRALFGEGRHPDRDAMIAAGASVAATKLGAAYPSYADLAPYSERLRQAVQDFEFAHGRPPSSTERNQTAAKEVRRGRRAVAGFDMVFTPVKSASILWGLGGPDIRQAVEDAHHDAVDSALRWIEQHAAYTRTGRDVLSDLEGAASLRRVLDRLSLRQDGTAAAASTIARKRATLHNALEYAVELELMATNPLHEVRWKAPTVSDVVDNRVVVNPDQARRLLRAAVWELDPALAGFFACLY